MVAVAYRRWSFTRGSNCKVLTGKILLLLILVLALAYRRWSYMDVRLYTGQRGQEPYPVQRHTAPYRPYKGEKLKVGGRGGLHFGLG